MYTANHWLAVGLVTYLHAHSLSQPDVMCIWVTQKLTVDHTCMYNGSMHVAVCAHVARQCRLYVCNRQGHDIHMQSYKATQHRHPNYHTIHYKFLDHSSQTITVNVWYFTACTTYIYTNCIYNCTT